jgi:hypothetical protein
MAIFRRQTEDGRFALRQGAAVNHAAFSLISVNFDRSQPLRCSYKEMKS